MKGLSIEQKAKRYDEALEKSKRLYEQGTITESLCYVFPELKESEDEKIRKWIINEIKIKHHNLDEDNVDFVDKAIAWLENIPYTIDHEKREGFHLGYKAGLEKQGEKSLTVNVESMIEAYEQRLINQGNGIRNSPIVNMCVAAFKHGVENTLDELHLKQGEPSIKWNKNTKDCKPQKNHSVLIKTTHGIEEGEWNGSKHWIQYRWSGCIKDSDVIAWMELSDLDKQGEQKASYTTIVKTGDGGINALVTRELPIEMKSAEESLGIDSETYNEIVNACIFDENKPKFKVGDWITDGNITIQIEAVRNNCYLYCGDCVLYSTKVADKVYHLWTIQDAKDGDVLATEDNCICIFDNTVEEGKYPFAYCGLSMYGFKVYDRTLPFTHDNVYPATKEQCDLLFQKMKEAGYEWDAEKKELRKIEHNPAWSDDVMIANIRDDLFCYQTKVRDEDHQLAEDIEKEINWLRNLKERVQPQPKQKWSEEDEKIIGRIRSIIEAYAFSRSAVDVNGDLCEKEYIDADIWLKSLKQRIGR